MFHISVLMEEHSRDECATHSLASVRGPLHISLRTPSLRRLLRRCRVAETDRLASKNHGRLSS